MSSLTKIFGHFILLCSLTACGLSENEEEEGSPLMRPGENCLSCHKAGGSGEIIFSAAGTVFSSKTAAASAGLKGAVVELTDANGKTVNFTTNAAGNFYFTDTIASPYGIKVTYNGKSVSMTAKASTGACNSCHTSPPQNDAPGRIYIE